MQKDPALMNSDEICFLLYYADKIILDDSILNAEYINTNENGEPSFVLTGEGWDKEEELFTLTKEELQSALKEIAKDEPYL